MKCKVTFRQEGWRPRDCVFTYRSSTDNILRCTNCGRKAPNQ